MNHVIETVNDLKKNPDLALILLRIQAELKEEANRRLEYYELEHGNFTAEFINGVIFYHSPAMRRHWRVCANLLSLLNTFVRENKLGEVGSEKVMVSLTRNDYEPDIVFYSSEKSRHFTPEQMHFPAPDLAVEILSNSTEKNDRNIKFVDYAVHGVREYWIIDPDKCTIEQYLNTEGEFILFKKYKNGILSTETVPGFSFESGSIFG